MPRPSLLLIETKKGKVTRYWPKQGDQRPASFITQTAEIYQLNGVWMLGGEEGLDLLEQFRSGKLDAQPIEATEKECA